MLENYSVTWGGRGNIVIPTDILGQMNQAFWPLIEIFDADAWASYVTTRRGQQMANPQGFGHALDRQVQSWVEEHGGEPEQVRSLLTEDHLMSSPLGGWPPPEQLVDELVRRTAPTSEDGKLIFKTYRADGRPGHHLVDVLDLSPLPPMVTVVDDEDLPRAVQLLLALRLGRLAPSSIAMLSKRDVEVRRVQVAEADVATLLRLAWFGPQERPDPTDRLLAALVRLVPPSPVTTYRTSVPVRRSNFHSLVAGK